MEYRIEKEPTIHSKLLDVEVLAFHLVCAIERKEVKTVLFCQLPDSALLLYFNSLQRKLLGVELHHEQEAPVVQERAVLTEWYWFDR
jgi:hypothetical protein